MLFLNQGRETEWEFIRSKNNRVRREHRSQPRNTRIHGNKNRYESSVFLPCVPCVPWLRFGSGEATELAAAQLLPPDCQLKAKGSALLIRIAPFRFFGRFLLFGRPD